MQAVQKGVITAICLALLPAFAAGAFAEEAGVEVKQVEVGSADHSMVLLLIAGNRFVPINVDPTVGISVLHALSGTATPRPLSHDLMRLILLEFDAKVTKVVITLKDKTYYADMTVTMGDRTWVFDSRSSDAIALAILFKAPIIVVKPTWDSASQSWNEPPGETS